MKEYKIECLEYDNSWTVEDYTEDLVIYIRELGINIINIQSYSITVGTIEFDKAIENELKDEIEFYNDDKLISKIRCEALAMQNDELFVGI